MLILCPSVIFYQNQTLLKTICVLYEFNQFFLSHFFYIQFDFRPRKEGKTIERSVYQFVTTDELKSLQDEYLQKAEVKLQMPPAMEERNPKVSF